MGTTSAGIITRGTRQSRKMAALEDLCQRSKALFSASYNTTASIAACAPGRVNLIGEHTDYNDGFVFPMAIEYHTVIAGSQHEGNVCRVVTDAEGVDEPKSIEFLLPSDKTPLKPGLPKWANYVKGVVSTFPGNAKAFQIAICSNVPLGGGLSSSASLEVAMYTFLEALNGAQHDLQQKALACQKAEHDFPGMPCGIMDQFISTMGKESNALLLDCRSKETELIPLLNPDVIVLIINSNVKHELTGSEYPTRRKQCEEAATLLGRPSLREVSSKELNDKKHALSDVVFRRARHVITEIERTTTAAAALKKEDYETFGRLMVESHNSLRDDYEVSCPELDLLVKLAMEVKGVYGSRMTGGGFGGCTVSLVRNDVVDALIKHVQAGYQDKATIFTSKPAEGARILPC